MRTQGWVLGAGVVVVLLVGCPETCDRSNCPGCCDSSGVCLPGTSRSFCGGGGVVCQPCGASRRCSAGLCVDVVDAGSPDAGDSCLCPRGCCASQSCQPGNLNEACGLDGGACVTCEAGLRCEAGACVPAACSGCLDPVGVCRSGSEPRACGRNSALCQACAPLEVCLAGACSTQPCNSTTCRMGCCLAGVCQTASAQTCGINGAPCTVCAMGRSCVNGFCR
jgi:hypothetical protein